MVRHKCLLALGGSLLVGTAGIAMADTTPDLRAEVAALQARIAELEGRQSETWLNERRAEEVKGLVREVLADADTRASLMESGLTAGHNGQNFYISSEDGSFLLKPYGQVQVRHNANFRRSRDRNTNPFVAGGAATDSKHIEQGFELTRGKIGFAGHISSPRIQYDVRLATDRFNNDVYVDKATLHYEVWEGLWVGGGRDKDVFLREEMVESGHQLAVERSVVNEVFTNGITQGAWTKWHAMDELIVRLSFNGGPRSGEYTSPTDTAWFNTGAGVGPGVAQTPGTTWNGASSEFGVTARVDYALMGTWDQVQDFTGWANEDTSVVFGGAVSYSLRKSGDSVGTPLGAPGGTVGFTQNDNHDLDVLAWTLDASAEWNGLNGYVAYVGRHIADRSDSATNPLKDSRTQHGVVAQAGYHILPNQLEVFGRYEYLSLDVPGATRLGRVVEDEIHIVTAGFNYYFNKHATKLSIDASYAFNSLFAAGLFMGPGSNLSNLGYAYEASDNGGQVAIRTQLQLLF